MDFALDETRQAIAEVTRDVLTREPDPDSAWAALGRAGLLSGELDVLGISVVLYEIGRVASAVPGLSTLPYVGYAIEKQLSSRDRLVTVALRNTMTKVNGSRLSGKAVGVANPDRVYRILVPMGHSVFAVDPGADGITFTPTYSASGSSEFTMALNEVPAVELPGDAAELHRLALAGACAYGDGLLAGALDLTAAHVRTREQFGRPLATFQAVAQQIADVYVAARTLHLATWSACWRLDTGRDPDEDLAIAAYWLAEEIMPALHTCHHLHGGLGVDAGYPLHRYYSSAKDLVRSLGGAEHRLGLLGARIAC